MNFNPNEINPKTLEVINKVDAVAQGWCLSFNYD